MREQAEDRAPSLVPIPDPSALTTSALEREIAHLREVMEKTIEGRAQAVDRRFHDMDKAIELLERWRATQREATAEDVAAGVVAAKNVLDAQLAAEVNLTSHRFVSLDREMLAKFTDIDHQIDSKLTAIRNQITDQDRRFEQSKLDSKAAIDAALQAAKEAVGKTELVTDKQIAGIQVLVASIQKNYDDKLDALKDRFNDERNRSSTAAGSLSGGSQTKAALYATMGIIITVILFGMAIVGFALSHTGV